MNKLIEEVKASYESFWTKERIWLCTNGFLLLVVALFIQRYANVYVDRVAGAPVGDLLLGFLPMLKIDFFIVQGALILMLVIIAMLFYKPKYIPFTTKALALFIVLRAFFISLTHLGVNPHVIQLDTDDLGFGIYKWLFNTQNDFFFSGHTGVPILMALIFWKEKPYRYMFLITSFIFGASVLMARIHYSIDVFAAPFMTYSIYIMATKLFPKDFKLLEFKHKK